MVPRDPPTASDAELAIAAIEEDIVLAKLHPRQRITEDELLARFGLKRHVVREVLATLERMGLVERRKNIGALVRSFTRREVKELCAMRELLETEAAKRMPLPPPAEALERLSDIQRTHDRAVERKNLREVFRANLAFHRALFSLAGDEVLEQAIEEYARQTHAIRFSTLASAAVPGPLPRGALGDDPRPGEEGPRAAGGALPRAPAARARRLPGADGGRGPG